MPIYEYQCRECSHRLEKLQKMSDAPLTRCPECGKEALTKLVSAAGFRLAGGGWYETDFKKDGKRNLAGDAGASKSSEGGSDSGGKNGAKDGGKKDSTSSSNHSSGRSSGQSSGQSSTKSSDSSAKSGTA
ncbi:MAG TPA: zinc ribbon domain-containing protein [Wenzhouxiangellaceae bacterium]|nr:zinc ribbon domain-containing protein [Wenzhouxiangellaceae bacterium]